MIFRILLLFIFISINTCAFANQEGNNTRKLSSKELLSILPDDKLLGNREAPILMLEYASLTCYHCSDFHINVFPKIKKNYIDTGKVLYIFRHFPLDYRALKGAMISHCYDEQEGYYKFNKAVFSAIESWSHYNSHDLTMLRNIAKLGNLKPELYDRCINDKDIMDKIINDKSLAINELKINATPVFFIRLNDGSDIEGYNKIKHEGYKKHEYFADVINRLLKQTEVKKTQEAK